MSPGGDVGKNPVWPYHGEREEATVEQGNRSVGSGEGGAQTDAAGVIRVSPGDRLYPLERLDGIHSLPLPVLSCIGNAELLAMPSLGILCSRRCPGLITLRMHDLANQIRLREIVVAGGFQSPLERHCLEVFASGLVSVVYAPARSLERFRPRGVWRRLLGQGRLLVIAPSTVTNRRATVREAVLRNLFIGAISSALLVPHASPGSRTMGVARALLAVSRRVTTFDDPANCALLEAGAIPFENLRI